MHYFVEHYYPRVLLGFLSFVLIGNIPLGLIRSRFPRFSRPWARCIYIPILVNILLRRLIGLTFKVIPFIVLAVLAGQLIGGRLQNILKESSDLQL